jgi:hypothetical protein
MVNVMVFCELPKLAQYLAWDREVPVNDKLRKMCNKLANRIINGRPNLSMSFALFSYNCVQNVAGL